MTDLFEDTVAYICKDFYIGRIKKTIYDYITINYDERTKGYSMRLVLDNGNKTDSTDIWNNRITAKTSIKSLCGYIINEMFGEGDSKQIKRIRTSYDNLSVELTEDDKKLKKYSHLRKTKMTDVLTSNLFSLYKSFFDISEEQMRKSRKSFVDYKVLDFIMTLRFLDSHLVIRNSTIFFMICKY